jgi:Na+/H+-dicarboxylate symporter
MHFSRNDSTLVMNSLEGKEDYTPVLIYLYICYNHGVKIPSFFHRYDRSSKPYPGILKPFLVFFLLGVNLFLYKQHATNMGKWRSVLVVLISLSLILLLLRLIRHATLPTKIVAGLLLGVAVGLLFGNQAVFLKPIGTIFVRLITLIVVPLVFVSLFLGTASMGDLKKLGKIGAKTLVYYITTTVIAIMIGLILVTLFKPGQDVKLETSDQNPAFQQKETKISIVDNLIRIIPTNPVRSLTEGNMLQIIFLALLFGISVTTLNRARRSTLVSFFESINEAIFNIIHLVMKLAPYGVFALIASAIGGFGFDVLVSLIKYGLLVIFGLAIHSVIIISVFVKFIGKTSPLQFWRAIRPAMLLAFSTSSSNATLPVTMESVEKGLKIPRIVSSFVLPLGATINMDGTALYQCISIFFIAQIYGIEISFIKIIMVILSVVLASIGTAGAPMAGVLILVMILKSIGVPTEGIAMIMGIERIMDMARTTVNIVGDASATVVITELERKGLKRKT